ncbi:MAG TPA: Uma2 family endonuclease [Thermoanaerobaculia bacterium]|jgi:Uma2 family endonuclease|nr:Uma2 family endonuclease [Thermoanaerobaculia bacterium]
MATDPHQRLTIQEYLAFERQSETKHDYFDGEIFAMSGASRIHGLITGNIFGEIRNQLKGRPCEVYSESMRVRTPDDLFTYPDVVAVCGEPRFDDTEFDTLLNPMLIVEVLSPTTEGYDRGIKSARYRALPTLVEHVLVAQDRCHVEHLVRQTDGGHWLLEELSDLDGLLELPSIGCRLPLAEIYDRVFFL